MAVNHIYPWIVILEGDKDKAVAPWDLAMLFSSKPKFIISFDLLSICCFFFLFFFFFGLFLQLLRDRSLK